MFLLNICIYASLMLSLPQCTYQSCTEGTPRQCVDAEFAPGTNLAGEGFDITKMERKGAFVLDMNRWKRKDKTCTLCSNPYLENKKQKLPLSVVDWRPKQSCNMKVASALHRSSESLVSSSTSSVENNWQANLDINVGKKGASLMIAGTHSKLAEYSMEKTKNDKFSFTSLSMSCEYYSYRVSGTHKLHREFQKALKQLPKIYSPEYKQRFYKLIDNFGTHYITKVKLGGSVQSVTSIRQCQASLQGLSVEEVQMCLEAEASASIKAEAKAEVKHCQKDMDKMEMKTSFSGLFNDRFTEIKGGHTTEPDLLFSADKDPSAYKEWLNTLPQNPDIVSYSLDSLHELLPTNSPVRKNLRSAISHYILERGLWKNCSDHCQAGIKSDPRDTCVCQCHNDPAVNQDCCPTRKGMARVIITVQRASGLWGDHTTETDGYVKVFFNGLMFRRTPVIYNNNNPHWATIVDLGTQDLSSGNIVKFEVWDEDNKWDDDLLGQCEQVLSAGVKEDLCNMHHGQLFYKLAVKCAPSLSGATCKDYKPSPMSQSLKRLYVSRHAHPVPKAILLEMGVFVNETSSQRNQSLTQGFSCIENDKAADSVKFHGASSSPENSEWYQNGKQCFLASVALGGFLSLLTAIAALRRYSGTVVIRTVHWESTTKTAKDKEKINLIWTAEKQGPVQFGAP
ncbi:perforin-1-like isoform X2 [Epinephelus fuscoguttatus]|uniref:perforin-1-like isoform X2 n=1 Tax=Epinephelus fuscoguttatus TaxID=293821 RepID=UPI0020D0A1FD|nr:perforin-1-like isoform X2 [Epinephelus fuscoguttatus]